MPQFKTIDYSKMTYDCLGAYHSINAAGQLSYLYKFCLCCLYVFQAPFNSFDTWRRRKKLIAGCYWQIGQLTNVLNYLYDNTQNRIYIVQSSNVWVYEPNIDESESTVFEIAIDEGESTIFEPSINDLLISVGITTIYVPFNDSATLSLLISELEQIRISGTQYQIVSF